MSSSQSDNKPVVVVTGCSDGGIGSSLVIEFLKVRGHFGLLDWLLLISRIPEEMYRVRHRQKTLEHEGVREGRGETPGARHHRGLLH